MEASYQHELIDQYCCREGMMPDRPVWREGHRPAHAPADAYEAGQMYLEARLDYEHCRRQHEVDPNNQELLLALEAAHRRRRQAWTRWLNLTRPTLRLKP